MRGDVSDLFLSDTVVASGNASVTVVVEVLGNRTSVVVELTTGLDWLLLTPSWGSRASVCCIM
jgi:hypothetical protein